jgi:hypothetical protein
MIGRSSIPMRYYRGMENEGSDPLERWHKFIGTGDPAVLDELLAADVRFHSPVVWKPKEGKEMAKVILCAAASVLEDFRYVRKITSGGDWALVFEARIGSLTIRGVDLVKLDDDGRIVDFEVMVRPASALRALAEEMEKRLE